MFADKPLYLQKYRLDTVRFDCHVIETSLIALRDLIVSRIGRHSDDRDVLKYTLFL